MLQVQELIDDVSKTLRDAACGRWVSAEQLDHMINGLRELQRRDWAVRVLDAWQDQHGVSLVCAPEAGTCYWTVSEPRWNARDVARGLSRDAARLAAAQAVFPELDRNAPNWPGECP